MSYELHMGDCLQIMPTLAADSIDSIVCDPPYGLSFMGKDWDHGVPGVPFWEAALRVAKPGAMLLAFGGTRMHHRLMVAIEDAGWEIRDCLMWLYGSGFPKSASIGKLIDKAAGAEREAIAPDPNWRKTAHTESVYSGGLQRPTHITAPATDAAKRWDGWGTALKPAWEPIIMARKPLEGTVAANVLKWGVGGINVDACRIGHGEPEKRTFRTSDKFSGRYNGGENGHYRNGDSLASASPQGRWPANLLLDEEAARLLDEQTGELKAGVAVKRNFDGRTYNAHQNWGLKAQAKDDMGYGDTGGASRFFYVAKASTSERNDGLQEMTPHKVNDGRQTPIDNAFQRGETERLNTHPTVKPIELMRYLCRLTKTPFGGAVLDPFMGSGSTGCAAILEGRSFVGIEISAEYHAIATKRIKNAAAQPMLLEVT